MNFEIGKTYALNCYFSETRQSMFEDGEWETLNGKGGVFVTPLTEAAVRLLELYETENLEIDLDTPDFDHGGLECGNSDISEEPDYLEDALFVQKRRDTELF